MTDNWEDALIESGTTTPNPHYHCNTLDTTPCPTGEHDIREALAADLIRMGLMPSAVAENESADEEAYEALRDAPMGQCQWFAMCPNPATTTRTTPWGSVAACERCSKI